MALKHEVNSFVVFFFLVSAYSATGFASDIPEITSEFETIIETNANHSVFCQGNKPLKWTTPKTDKNINWTTFDTRFEQPTNPNYNYGSRLYITNMTYPFVGFYNCHNEDVDANDPEGSTNIYLYVNDEEHLSILDGEPSIETVIVPRFQEAIIPCRPSAPDVKVELSELAGLDMTLDIIHMQKRTLYRYDPTYGFFTNDTKEKDKDVIFECRFKKDRVKQNALVHLVVEIPVTHLAKPDLRDENEGHTVVGDRLTLTCKIKTTNTVNFHWSAPNGIDPLRVSISNPHKIGGTLQETLTVHNVTLDDKGFYFCNVTDIQSHSAFVGLDVKIFDVDEYFLNLIEKNGLYNLEASAGTPFVQWAIDVEGHPRPTVSWLNNANDTIQMGNGSKYDASYNPQNNVALLRIKNIAITDMGYYKVLASNNKTEKKLDVFLNVTDRPSVHLDIKPFHFINTPSTVKCYAYANPEPQFEWKYKDCQTDDCEYLPIKAAVTKIKSFEFMSEVTINASRTGSVQCSARNWNGYDEAISGFYVSDIKDGFDIFGIESTVILNKDKMEATLPFGDTIRVTCGASIYNFSNMNWLFNDQVLEDGDRIKITKSYTEYSNKIQLEIDQANYTDNGLYNCRVLGQNGMYYYRNISFFVTKPEPPIILRTNLQDEKEMNIPDNLIMYCEVFGVPKPEVTWFKNGAVFNPSRSQRIQITENNEKVSFNYTEAKDEGTYRCEARNRMGAVSKQQTIKFKNLPKIQMWLVYGIISLSLLFFAAIIFIAIKIRKERQLQRELEKFGLANFEKGAVENINPELGIDDQAELLPYNKKWEFPIENLKLGKQLGSGAFGVVMKGEAKNIIEGEPVTTVAVKMVKKNADYTYIKALASELKIMVHLGKHLNVVNLLGASTKNVAKRELFVIVEYCRYGNLQNYLLRHRDNYIDQVNPKTCKIDYTIGQDEIDRSYSVSSDRSNTQSPSLKYAALTFSNSGNHPILPPSNSMGDYRENARTGASTMTEMTTISQDDGPVTSNNSIQPEWRSNYKGDYKGNVKPICTGDLLAWAFQVARGMEYLASRKVLHGDLAARNILLSDNNVVKICDFGLAKSMYKSDNYKKRGDGPLPVKWMAIESIRDRVFSTQSDVWSFGIVLWEFFSLAKTPYPGMEANERLYQKLVDGYRMEAPEYAPAEIYNMMTSCWAPKPLARPSFTKLSERIGLLLEDSLRKHYIDLNDPYLVMNTQRLESGESDYLAMLSPPTFEALSTPHYINENAGKEPLEDSGYLSMKPNTVFSPRVEDGQVFDFNVSNRKHLESEDGNGAELLPMLRRPSESDCDTPLPTPNSFSNPSYHMPPKILKEGEDNTNNNDIVKTADNYVNMPQNKSGIKEKSTCNPFVGVSSGNGEVQYVNSNSKDWESVEV